MGGPKDYSPPLNKVPWGSPAIKLFFQAARPACYSLGLTAEKAQGQCPSVARLFPGRFAASTNLDWASEEESDVPVLQKNLTELGIIC